VGRKYVAPLDTFADYAARGAFRVVADAYVSSDSGTGLVHLAPAFGEDDFRICVREGIVEKDDRYSVYLLYWYQSTNTDAYISNMSCVDEQGRFTGRVRMLEVPFVLVKRKAMRMLEVPFVLVKRKASTFVLVKQVKLSTSSRSLGFRV